jgi:hypothetical protein
VQSSPPLSREEILLMLREAAHGAHLMGNFEQEARILMMIAKFLGYLGSKLESSPISP